MIDPKIVEAMLDATDGELRPPKPPAPPSPPQLSPESPYVAMIFGSVDGYDHGREYMHRALALAMLMPPPSLVITIGSDLPKTRRRLDVVEKFPLPPPLLTFADFDQPSRIPAPKKLLAGKKAPKRKLQRIARRIRRKHLK